MTTYPKYFKTLFWMPVIFKVRYLSKTIYWVTLHHKHGSFYRQTSIHRYTWSVITNYLSNNDYLSDSGVQKGRRLFCFLLEIAKPRISSCLTDLMACLRLSSSISLTLQIDPGWECTRKSHSSWKLASPPDLSNDSLFALELR